jgi:hypothetical protein
MSGTVVEGALIVASSVRPLPLPLALVVVVGALVADIFSLLFYELARL